MNEQGYEGKIQETGWRFDLRDDEPDGHLAAKEAFEDAGVGGEGYLSETLGVFDGAAAGKVNWVV